MITTGRAAARSEDAEVACSSASPSCSSSRSSSRSAGSRRPHPVERRRPAPRRRHPDPVDHLVRRPAVRPSLAAVRSSMPMTSRTCRLRSLARRSHRSSSRSSTKITASHTTWLPTRQRGRASSGGFPGVATKSYDIPALAPGTFPFACSVSSDDDGTATIQSVRAERSRHAASPDPHRPRHRDPYHVGFCNGFVNSRRWSKAVIGPPAPVNRARPWTAAVRSASFPARPVVIDSGPVMHPLPRRVPAVPPGAPDAPGGRSCHRRRADGRSGGARKPVRGRVRRELADGRGP